MPLLLLLLSTIDLNIEHALQQPLAPCCNSIAAFLALTGMKYVDEQQHTVHASTASTGCRYSSATSACCSSLHQLIQHS